MKVLFLDNYDSFTNTIVYYLENLGISSLIIKNDQKEFLDKAKEYDGLIISPGPGNINNSGQCGNYIKEFEKLYKPVLGICLGFQVICFQHGGVLIEKKVPAHGEPFKIQHFGDKLFNNIPEYSDFACYNSLKIDNVNSDVEVTAIDSDKTIMACRVKNTNTFGVQFHPESFMSPDGNNIFINFKEILTSVK